MPDIQRNTELSKDFENLTFDTRLNEGRHAENIADRNISGNRSSTSPLHTKHGHGNLRESLDRERPMGPRDPPPAVPDQPRRSVNGARASRDFASNSTSNVRSSTDRVREGIPRSSLEKPLPVTPAPLSSPAPGKDGSWSLDDTPSKNAANLLENKRNLGIKDSATPIDLKGVVDLTNTADTTLEESWAPAVTHNMIVEEHRDIREEQITREIHTHDVHHRILPVIDIEVKPARHFIPVEGGYAEIAEEELPGRTGENAKWAIAEFVSKSMSKGGRVPRQFTARKFEGSEGEYKERKMPEGHTRTEQCWVHPPTLEDGGMRSGQTYPFHFGSADTKDDGLRARLPEGHVIGTSELYARKMKEQQGKQAEAKTTGGQDGYQLPPVPAHRELPADWEDARKGAPGTTPDGNTLSPRFL